MNRQNPDLSRPLLAIDTSTPACSVALRAQDDISQRFQEGEQKHTRILLAMIEELLSERQLSSADLGGIILSSGPGAFTGLRVGAAVAAGLAVAHETPLGRCSSLALLAASAEKAAGETVLALLDARMRQCYAGCYQIGESSLERLAEDQLVDVDSLSESRLMQSDWLIGPGTIYYEHLKSPSDAQIERLWPQAKAAFDCLTLVDWQSPWQAVELNYLRDQITQS